MKKTIDIESLRKNNLIIFEGITGSKAYGTSLPESDTDIRGVFVLPQEHILGMGYIDQVSDKNNDIIFYEIKRFLELVSQNNPNILEMLNLPADCILYKNPIFDLVLNEKNKFITKQCRNTFAGYAVAQIKKARGYNKKINWEKSSMVRKNVLDFCYVLDGGKSITLHQFLKKYNHNKIDKYDQRDFGLANIDHSHNLYAMYNISEYASIMYNTGAPFLERGIVSDPEKANDVKLCSIPKELSPIAYLSFNKDAYSTHCKRYAEYKEWLDNRNEDRFKMNKEHGKNYDSKNMMHTFRLLNMAEEISQGKIIVRRSEKEIKTLMAIRKGEYDYDKLLSQAESKISSLDELYNNSNLPDKVDKEFIDNLLITIRKLRYMLSQL